MGDSSHTPNVPVVIVKDGQVVADSRDVAAAFGKQHKDVLRKIDALLAEAPDLHGRNFTPMIVEVEIGKGAVRRDRAYEMDRSGFSLLAMRFTGPKALQWQIAYVGEFERMEAALHSSHGDLMLTADARSAIGGIVKGIVHKELSQIVPTLVAQQVLSSRYSIIEGVCAVEVVEMAGYKTGQRPKGASQFVTRRLARFHEENGVPIRRDRRGIIKTRLFDEATARRWLASGGKTEIDHYIAGRKGQGALRLVQP